MIIRAPFVGGWTLNRKKGNRVYLGPEYTPLSWGWVEDQGLEGLTCMDLRGEHPREKSITPKGSVYAV